MTVPAAPGPKRVLERVVHQLRERQRERGGRAGVDRPGASRDVDRHTGVVADGPAAHQLDHAAGDLDEVDALVVRVREQVVHGGHGGGARGRLAERAPHLFVVAAPGLHAQQRRDGLEVVLHPVVDLADGRLLDRQLALAPAPPSRSSTSTRTLVGSAMDR